MIANRQRAVSIDLDDLNAFGRRLSRAVGVDPESFSVALVSDRRIAALNRRFRGVARPTDVLSFGGSNSYRGDVVISVQTARRQARLHRHSVSEEIRLLMLHGLLHLMGYDHETDNGQMNRREHALRRRLGLE